MSRTTADQVKALLTPGGAYDLVNNPDVSPFIDSASILIDAVNECALSKDITLTSAQLEIMERWVAAHAYVMTDQRPQEEWDEKAKAVYQGRTGLNLEASKYGQMALSLDTSGCLSAISSGRNRKAARGYYLGRRPSEQTDYQDRD
jgi:hypothetical protein